MEKWICEVSFVWGNHFKKGQKIVVLAASTFFKKKLLSASTTTSTTKKSSSWTRDIKFNPTNLLNKEL